MADITFKHVKKVYDKGNVVVPDLNLEIKECCIFRINQLS